jgi:uncharacterized membrane protein (GlpM family)
LPRWFLSRVSPAIIVYWTILGAHFYFWGRLGYLLAAVSGLTFVRSVLCWNIAVIGILLFVVALLWEYSTNYA